MFLGGIGDVPSEHGLDGLRVTLGNPVTLGMFIDDEDIIRRIPAAEESNAEMGVAVVHGSEPFHRLTFLEGTKTVELIDEVTVAFRSVSMSRRGLRRLICRDITITTVNPLPCHGGLLQGERR